MSWLLPVWICILLVFVAMGTVWGAFYWQFGKDWFLFGAGLCTGCALKTVYTIAVLAINEL